MTTKLDFAGERIRIPVADGIAIASRILQGAGCPSDVADEVAEHLADADLCGVESHGLMRSLQYVDYYNSGYMKPAGRPVRVRSDRGTDEVDGGGGIGIPAMRMATELAVAEAKSRGIAAVAVRNVGHTGRLGAYAEAAAAAGTLIMIVGGGNRQRWRQVAPYGGRKAVLPTNPYCLGSPGGGKGPIVIDFATSMIAGGWLYSAKAAGALIPAGCIIDSEGVASRDPAAYFAGGAILPKGGPMGYGMAVMAEMICEAMLGPPTAECNWLILALDTERYRGPTAMRAAAEAVLDELRTCPPAPGFSRVEVPGERERALREQNKVLGIPLPKPTWEAIGKLAAGSATSAH